MITSPRLIKRASAFWMRTMGVTIMLHALWACGLNKSSAYLTDEQAEALWPPTSQRSSLFRRLWLLDSELPEHANSAGNPHSLVFAYFSERQTVAAIEPNFDPKTVEWSTMRSAKTHKSMLLCEISSVDRALAGPLTFLTKSGTSAVVNLRRSPLSDSDVAVLTNFDFASKTDWKFDISRVPRPQLEWRRLSMAERSIPRLHPESEWEGLTFRKGIPVLDVWAIPEAKPTSAKSKKGARD